MEDFSFNKRFIDLVKENKNLKFIDAESNIIFSIDEFVSDPCLRKQKKGLVFLYLDNSIDAVKTLLTTFDSPNALALLSPKLNLAFKDKLENLYSPDFIFDPLRNKIDGYNAIGFLEENSIFEKIEKDNKILHSNLKVLLTTSGTTGSPKFVKLSEVNIITNAKSILSYLPIVKTDITPLNLSIFYSYGLSVLTSNCLGGGTIVCTNKDIINKEFWVDFDSFGYSTIAGVPYVYEMLNRIGFLKKTYPNLRYMTQAGGKLNLKIKELFIKYFKLNNKELYVMYGQTEATARMAYLPPRYLEDKIDSIGIPIPNGSFQINSETSELIYQGPNIFGGYANKKEDLSTFKSNLELATGDIASMDSDGFYYIIGRLKRFIKIFGTRINLDEVEAILSNKFDGSPFYAIGKNDEKLILFILNENIDENLIKAFIKEKLNIHPSVIKIYKISDVPLTSNGKIDYTFLQNYL